MSASDLSDTPEANLVSDQVRSRFDPRLRTKNPVRPPTVPRERLDDRRVQEVAERLQGSFPASLGAIQVRWSRRPSVSRQGLYRADLVRFHKGRNLVELHATLAVSDTPEDILTAFVFLGLLMAFSKKEEPFDHPSTVAWIEQNMDLCPASEFLGLFISRYWIWLTKLAEKSLRSHSS